MQAMKKLSLWGKNHKKTSYIIIICSTIFLNTFFGIIGLWLEMDNINIPIFATYALFVVLMIIVLLYPYHQKNKVGNYSDSYAKRKMCDFIMFGTTALFVLCLANQESASMTLEENKTNKIIQQGNAFFRYVSNATTEKSVTQNSTQGNSQNTTLSFDDTKPKHAKYRKEIRKTIKKYLKDIKNKLKTTKGKNLNLFIKILLTIFALPLIGLIFVAGAILSCDLSCSGNGAAATVVIFATFGLMIGVIVLVVRMWIGKKKIQKEAEAGLLKNTPQ